MIEADVQPREGATTVSAADRSDAEVILSAERGDDPEMVAALMRSARLNVDAARLAVLVGRLDPLHSRILAQPECGR